MYANGVKMIHNEFEGDVKADCVFEGTGGKILVSRNKLSSVQEKAIANPRRVYESSDHKKNWLDCIKSGKETICPAEIGHRSASICHLGNIGYRLGRKLKWDPEKELFVGDEKANKELSREPRAKWKI